ncbi:MAG: ATP-binding protein [Verrucomicrobia bacterium]|nr:ATP-binding protein [Verrucomicrobiota bacterium]
MIHNTSQSKETDEIVHVLENFLFFLIGPIFYAAHFFSRSTYVGSAAYAAMVATATVYLFDWHEEKPTHFVDQTIIIIIAVIVTGMIFAEVFYRSAKRVQQAIQEKHDAERKIAETASRQKSLLLANVSHEIRNPLNGMCGMIRLLKDTPLNEEQSDYVSVLDESTGTLMSLVNDLLDVSKMESGKLELDQDSFSLRKLIQDCSKLFQAELRRKSLSFETTFNTDLPLIVIGDKNRMRQVLLNLMANAVKFTDSGSIRIHTEAEATKQGDVNLEISVADTGIGIPQNQLESIFDVYSQAHGKADGHKYGGTGLGLAISKKIVQHMGGRIALESRLTMGSTFKVLLTMPMDSDSLTQYDI